MRNVEHLVTELRDYARTQGISQKQLASQLGVPVNTLQKWFTKGKGHKRPSQANIGRIETLLEGKVTSMLRLDVSEGSEGLSRTTTAPGTAKGGIMAKSNIFEPYKTVRDPVQGDITLTRLEVEVIDTCAFQRLRRIKQLGTANFVYPGATHTRFDHSLGVVAVAQNMIDMINRNLDNQVPIDNECVNLIRLCALLHDITHIPFGHSLEDEGHVFPCHDRPGEGSRFSVFIGPSSEIGGKIFKHVGKEFHERLFTHLTTKGEEIKDLDFPFVADIVGNTICADLLDYLARDIYFTGLRESYDPRFLKYLLISGDSDDKFKNRLVLSLFKKNMIRRDVVSEVVHLLRLRFSLAEKVYFHHAKVIVSAMIIEAVQAAKRKKLDDFSEKALSEMGDEELLHEFKESGDSIAVKLVEKLRLRSLYKPVYMLAYSVPTLEDKAATKKNEIITKFKENPDERFDLERRLEKWNRLPEGSVIIYCPGEDMNLKQVDTLTMWEDGKISKLIEAPGKELKTEVETVNEKHKALWKMYVFLEPGLPEEPKKAQDLANDCFHTFGLPNAIESLSEVGQRAHERYIEEWALAFPNLAVTILEKKQLIETRRISSPGFGFGDPPSYEDLGKELYDLRGIV